MQTVKNIVFISAIILLVIFGYKVCQNISSNIKLKPDGTNLFISEEALYKRLPFVKYVYVGHISEFFPNNSLQNDTSRKDIHFFIKLSFKTDIPINVFEKQFKKIESEDKNKTYQELVNKTRASVKMRIPIVCIDDVINKNEYTTKFIAVNLVQAIIDSDKPIIVFDSKDDHIFYLYHLSDTTTFLFNKDYTSCRLNCKSYEKPQEHFVGELKRVDLYDKFDLAGYYHINFQLVSLGVSMMGESTYVTENQLYFTGQVFFKTSENNRVGKFYIRGNSYDLFGYREGDCYRLFADNKHYLQIRNNFKSISFLAPDFGNNLSFQNSDMISDGVYLTDLSKASLPPGKEDEMFKNFDKLGNAPATDKFNPESWTYYEKIEPHLSNCEEVLKDDDLFNIFQNSSWLKSYIQSHYSLNDVGYVFGMGYNPQKVRAFILSKMSGSISLKTPGKQFEKKKKKNNLSDIMGE